MHFIKTTTLFFLSISTIIACERHPVTLQKIYELPEYMKEKIRFGTNIESLNKLNASLLVTGVIDTTDEFPPQNICIIRNNNKQLMLNLIQQSTRLGFTVVDYQADSFKVHLEYKKVMLSSYPDSIYKGEIVISSHNLNADYKVVGVNGYY